jgi:hypothetical protein
MVRPVIPDPDVTHPDRDLGKGHPLLQQRWPILKAVMSEKYGWEIQLIEVYRPELRQMWLYGAGRTSRQLLDAGIPISLSRPYEPRVTNAKSSRLSAHGWLQGTTPAAAAADVCPVGKDGRAFTRDDPFDDFVVAVAREASVTGLIHFHSASKGVWDRPHVQLDIWCDRHHVVHDDGLCPERGDLRILGKRI